MKVFLMKALLISIQSIVNMRADVTLEAMDKNKIDMK